MYRDPAVVNHVKSLSRKDLERLAIVQATHLRTYLDFYGKNLVNHIAIDGYEMTRVGCGLQRARGVKSAADLKEGGVLKKSENFSRSRGQEGCRGLRRSRWR